MKHGRTLGLLVLLTSAAWAADKAPKKFNASPAHPHHSLTQIDKSGHARADAGNPLPAKSQAGRNQELSRLEHQGTTHVHGQAAAKGGRPSATASHAHAVTPEHSSNIKFNYRAPHNQSKAASGGRKH
jgi:hypothetical protein